MHLDRGRRGDVYASRSEILAENKNHVFPGHGSDFGRAERWKQDAAALPAFAANPPSSFLHEADGPMLAASWLLGAPVCGIQVASSSGQPDGFESHLGTCRVEP